MDFEVAVVGSGVVGSLLTRALSEAGIEVCLIDFQDPFRVGNSQEFLGKTASLNLFSINFLKNLNLWNSLKKKATSFNKIYVWDGEGSSDLEFLADEIGEKDLGFIISHNSILLNLYPLLKNSKKVSLKLNTSVSNITRKSDQVEITTSTGEKIISKLVVGADGGKSIVRELSDISTFSWSYDQKAFVSLLRSEKGHENTSRQVFTSYGPIALLPFDLERTANISLVWSVENNLAERLSSLDIESFLETLEAKTEHILGNLAVIGEITSFPLHQLQAKRYFSERIVLVGDALHSIHPLAGQGLNLGIADIEDLQQKVITSRRRGIDIGTRIVLEGFENSRKSQNLMMAGIMEIFKRGFESPNPWINLSRNLIFQATKENDWLRKKFIEKATGLT